MVQEKIADPIFKYHRQLKHTGIGNEKKFFASKRRMQMNFEYIWKMVSKKSQQRETLCNLVQTCHL